MGEYWQPVNFTRRQFVDPHEVGNGVKLGEWYGYDSATMARVKALLKSGAWLESDDVAAVSDYGGDIQMHGERSDRSMHNDDSNGGLWQSSHEFFDASVADPLFVAPPKLATLSAVGENIRQITEKEREEVRQATERSAFAFALGKLCDSYKKRFPRAAMAELLTVAAVKTLTEMEGESNATEHVVELARTVKP